MIFYGTNGTHYATEALAGSCCPACHAPEALQLGLVSRYAHVYWIPLFPFQKVAVTQCLNCQASWTEKQLAPTLVSAVRTAKQRSRAPYWTWAGLPHAGDIYTVRSDSSQMYSLLKVRQVGGNIVELVANEYETENATPINSLNAPSRYSKEPFTLTFLDLQIMRRKGQLTDVDRLED